MQKYFTIEKKVGETPLEALEKSRTTLNIPIDTPLAYAGRLDPMASGKLLVLVGDECKKQEEYHGLDKEYLFEVLFEYETDTGDILGMPSYTSYRSVVREDEVRDVVSKLTNTEITLPYPIYSSKTVKGKPLFLWALEGKLKHIEIPTATTKIHKLTYVGGRQLSPTGLEEYIQGNIARLKHVTEESKELGADFRRVKILQAWKKLLESNDTSFLAIGRFSCVVSSGTYIRSLAPHIASRLGTKGLALSIHRTEIGRYSHVPFLPRLGFWRKKF